MGADGSARVRPSAWRFCRLGHQAVRDADSGPQALSLAICLRGYGPERECDQGSTEHLVTCSRDKALLEDCVAFSAPADT